MLPKCRARSDAKFERILKKNSTLIKLRASKFEKEILENTVEKVSGLKAELSLSDKQSSQAISGINKRKRQSDHGHYMCQQNAKRVRKSRLCTNSTYEIDKGQINNDIHSYKPNVSLTVRKRKFSEQSEYYQNHDRMDIQSPIVKRVRLQHAFVPGDCYHGRNKNVANSGFIRNILKYAQNEHNSSHDQGYIQPTDRKGAIVEDNFVPSLCNNDSNKQANNGISVLKYAQNEHNNNHDQGGLQSNKSKTPTLEHNFVASQSNDNIKSVVSSGYMTNVLSLKASMKFMNRSLKSKKYSSCKNGSYSLGSKSDGKIGHLKPSFPCLSNNKSISTRGSDTLANYFAKIEL